MAGATLVLGAVLFTAVPVIVYLWILWLVDRHEKEPASLLGIALLGGAIVAPLLTVVIERLLGVRTSIFPALFQLYPVVPPSLGGAVVEELTKAVVIYAAFVLIPREFDGALDGVIYGATVGAGFALAESLVYVTDLIRLSPPEAFGPGFFLAIFLSGLTHCTFSGIFGASLGYLRETSATGGARRWIPLAGLAAAVIYHTAYVGFPAAAGGQPGALGIVLALARQLADWSGLLLLAVIVALAWRRERAILRWGLADETTSGAVSPEELSVLERSGRLAAARPVREAQAELAFAKWRATRGLATAGDITALRDRVLALKGAGTGTRS